MSQVYLNSVEISDNMVLEGIEQADPLIVEQLRSIDGTPYLRTYNNDGGRKLSLGTSETNRVQGIWYKYVLDDIKEIQKTKLPATLTYYGKTYIVMVVSTENIKPMHAFEPPNDCKQFLGTIDLIEVN